MNTTLPFQPTEAAIQARMLASTPNLTHWQARLALVKEHPTAVQAAEAQTATAVKAALGALSAFWNSLTPQQQLPLLRDKVTIQATLATDTHAAVLLIPSLEASVTGLTTEQTAKQSAALAACEALLTA